MGGFVLRKKSASRDVAAQAGTQQQQPSAAGASPTKPELAGSVRLTIGIDRELHTRLKLESVRRGEPIVAMVSRWIEEKMPKG